MEINFSTVILLLLVSLELVTSTNGVPPSDCSYDSKEHLTCHLSSINSMLEKTDFSVVPNATLSLQVICRESAIGALEPAGFGTLTNLQHLVIEGCNLRTLPTNAFLGLRSLKSLAIRTDSIDGLNLEVGAFNGLESLERLDLSRNGLAEFDSGLLCRLTSLQSLVLSSNKIGSELAVAAGCPSILSSLDLSANQITELEPHSLLSLPSLTSLNLDNNYIRYISAEVFTASTQLNSLRLSNNQINHLPAGLFANVPLRELNLANNSLSALPMDIFKGRFDLEVLSLAGNILMTRGLPSNLTVDLVNLLQLDLCHNQIQAVSTELLAPMVNLQTLKMCGNQLKAVVFPASLFNLATLDLSSNQLEILEVESLLGLPNLSQLDLSSNQLLTIQPEAFKNNTHLLILDLSSNKLWELPAAISGLVHLQTVDLSHNQISRLDTRTMAQLSSLWRLQIHHNLISTVPTGFFGSFTSLQVLDLSNNRLEVLAPGSLTLNPLLRAVRLDGNELQEIHGLFSNLTQLTWLNVSNNNIQVFDYSLVPSTLAWLDLSRNELTDLGNYFNVENSSLTFLDASFNRLRNIASANLPLSLETILLNDNMIRDIAQYTFFDKQNLGKVDLTVNELAGLSKPALLLSPLNEQSTTFLLGGNPIVCDCHMTWFKTINSLDTLENFPFVADLESIYCRLMSLGEQSFTPLVEARNDQFLCEYETHCFSLCQCCQFDSCDCEMTCPDGCSCYHDNSWTKNIIQCASQDFTALPANIPMDATELYLDGNRMETLRSHSFIGRKNLRALHLNNSNIERIENQTFNGLKSLTSLHLQNNQIQVLKGFEFSGLTHLRELYLENNNINYIHNATFKALRSLEVLFLQGNSIIDYPVWELALNPYLISLRLADNLWSCECEFMNRFHSWVNQYTAKVTDKELISCTSNNLDGEIVQDIVTGLPCELDLAVATNNNQLQQEIVISYMPIMIAVVALFSVIVISGFIIFGFRSTLKHWCGSKSSSERMIESPSPSQSTTTSVHHHHEQDKNLFDAYISYSARDSLLVDQVVYRELETRYRLCLHHRDIQTNTVLTETVHKVSEASGKIIIVLSQNFLQTEWSRMDYKAGLLQTLSTGSKRVIFLVAGVLDLTLIDPTLRLLLKTGEVVSISDPGLMQRLELTMAPAAVHNENHYYSTMKFPNQDTLKLPTVYIEQDKHVLSHI